MPKLTIRDSADSEPREVEVPDDLDIGLPDGAVLLAETYVRENYKPNSVVETIRSGVSREIEKATKGRYKPDEIVENEELLTEILEPHKDRIVSLLGIEAGKPGVDEHEVERLQERWRKREVEPLSEKLEVLESRFKQATEKQFMDTVRSLAGDPEIGLRSVEAADVLAPWIRQRVAYDEEHQGWFEVGEDGRFELSEAGNGVPYRTPRELVMDLKKSGKYDYLFASKARDGADYRGSGPSGGKDYGGVRKKTDLKSDKEKAAFIGEHGGDAYLDLPDE